MALTALPQSKRTEKKEGNKEPIITENGNVRLTIQSVTKNDAGARKNAGGKSRNVPVSFTSCWMVPSR